jgi:hypothetical protein
MVKVTMTLKMEHMKTEQKQTLQHCHVNFSQT